MTAPADEIQRRDRLARNAIQAQFESAQQSADPDEEGVVLFVSHHLTEIDEEFWMKHCNVARPEPTQIFKILVLQSHWGEEEEDGIDTFDYTLPEDETQYLISVSFDESGAVCEISMES